MAESLTQKDLLDLFVCELTEFVIVLADPQGTFISWNPGVQEQFGYSAEEFIGQPLDVLIPVPDRLRGDARLELKTAAATGRCSDTRWLVKKGGQRIFVEGITVGLRDKAGELAGFGKVLRDISERKSTDENLRALARALDQSIVIVRQFDGTVEHWTTGCEKFYGYSPHDAVGQICHVLLKTKFPAPLEDIQQRLLKFGSWSGELEHRRKDGTTVFVSTHWLLLTDSEDEPVSVVETQTDITGRLMIQEELENVNERLKSMAFELERSNEELEEFARIASHDLSAPITSARWLVDLLATRHQEKLDADALKIVKQIGQGLARMADLVEGILAHARVGKGAISSLQTANSEEALVAAMANLSREIETSGATIKNGRLPNVQMQPQALSQLFQNLLSNAIKYRRADTSPQIEVSAESDGTKVLFRMRDNGSGIEPEWLERIFQPLQRRSSPDIAGSGLGLATCRKIVGRVGGKIWAESEVGRGSTFLFTLPAPPETETGHRYAAAQEREPDAQ